MAKKPVVLISGLFQELNSSSDKLDFAEIALQI